MALTHDFLLTMTDDGGDLLHNDGSQIDLGLAGAALVELMMRGDLGLDKKTRLLVQATGDSTGSAALDEARRRFIERDGKKVADTLPRVVKGLRDAIYAELQSAGSVRREDFKTLGVISRHRWPVTDTARSHGLRRAVLEAIERPEGIDAGSAALVTLVSATDSVKGVTRDQHSDLSTRELKKRAKAIAEGDLAGEAVSRAIRDAQAAIGAAVAASSAATVATTSN